MPVIEPAGANAGGTGLQRPDRPHHLAGPARGSRVPQGRARPGAAPRECSARRRAGHRPHRPAARRKTCHPSGVIAALAVSTCRPNMSSATYGSVVGRLGACAARTWARPDRSVLRSTRLRSGWANQLAIGIDHIGCAAVSDLYAGHYVPDVFETNFRRTVAPRLGARWRDSCRARFASRK